MSATRIATELEVREVDVHDDDAVAAWLHVVNTADRHERGEHSTPWRLPELLAGLREPTKHRRHHLFVGVADDRVVASGGLGLPLLDNLSAADIEVSVLPDLRRRGYGTRMLEVLESRARQEGRTRFDSEVGYRYELPSDGAGVPGVEFGKRHGYGFGIGDVQRELPLPVDEALLAEIAGEAAPYHSDYELRTFTTPFPEEHLRSYLELSSRLNTEAPTGDNEYEDEAVDLEAFRMHEARLRKQDRLAWHTVALDREGTVVGYTDLVVPEHDPDFVMQWGTLVDRTHRGHRLGLAVKIANLRAVQAAHVADGRRLVTWNAEVNDHMIGINERLGFRAVARGGELQKKIA
ncbi:MAG TPA: GNAT family N-acetyltransferase [Nocardioides sp.]|nr:GNAT family N-acetyltransferase [Nocardioides sp.]